MGHMKTFVATMTTNGRITIPVEVRRLLGISTPGKVVWLLADDGTIELRSIEDTIASLRGVVSALPGRETGDFDELINEAIEDRADRIVRNIEGR